MTDLTSPSCLPHQGAAAFLVRLRHRLGLEGLHIVLPLSPASFDAVATEVGGPRLADLMADAKGAVLVGDGGATFFERFQAARAGGAASAIGPANPLDDYTRAVVVGATEDVFGGGASGTGAVRYRVLYPFLDARPALPFQRLGSAAGLPAAGPLGIQIHPTFGPWWAYRALVVVSAALEVEAALSPSCSTCVQPCVTVCPGRAVEPSGFSSIRCMAERTSSLGGACRQTCAARSSCPVGSAHRYSDQQVAFHMSASLAFARSP